jgi:Fur family transcriptional regulator, peroxide stress response regulator
VERKTKQKESIINILRQTTSHPDADWIYERVRQEIPNISLGTVYRNLKSLKESGQIQELNSMGEMSHFDGNAEPHYHFRCDCCGRIIDIEGPVDKTIEKRVARKTGFRVTRHSLEVGGLCLDCQRAQNQ